MSCCVCMLSHSVVSTFCGPMDCSLSGSSVLGIFQARILEWVAIPYSRGSSRPRDQTCISCVSCIDRWILHHQATWEAHIYMFVYIHTHTSYKILSGGKSLLIGWLAILWHPRFMISRSRLILFPFLCFGTGLSPCLLQGSRMVVGLTNPCPWPAAPCLVSCGQRVGWAFDLSRKASGKTSWLPRLSTIITIWESSKLAWLRKSMKS